MANFMVVYKDDDGKSYALFCNTIGEVKIARQTLECAMCYYSEVYSRIKEDGINQYVLLYA